jgi:TRAP transporter TAXI family solute receptor
MTLKEKAIKQIAKKMACYGLVFATVLSQPLAATAESSPKQQFFSMGTSSAGGSFFPLAGAMSSVIAKHYPQIKINAEITGGSNENVKLIANRKLELALMGAQAAFDGHKGIGKFATSGPQKKHMAVMAGHGTYWQLFTLKKTGIKTIADLKGKKVSLGSTGSEGNTLGKEIIEAHGLVMNKDWKAEYISHGEGPGALRDGRIDAVLQVSSVPTGTVTDITATHGSDVVFVNPDAAVLAKLSAEKPYFAKAAIPGGAYKGHDKPTPGSFKASAILTASADLSADTVYAIVKALLENPTELSSANALGKYWNKDDAVDPIKNLIPIHPGALKYYKEKGLM